MPIALLFTIGFIHLMGVMTPGPDFIVVTQSALMHQRRQAFWVVAGIVLGNLIHITYCILGFALLIQHHQVALQMIKFIGAAYLLYLGIKGLNVKSSNSQKTTENQADFNQPFIKGFLCNITNIKAVLYFIGIFSVVIKPDWPLTWQLILGLEMLLITALWFSALACFISHRHFRARLLNYQTLINRILSIVLIAFALLIIFYEIK